MSAHTYQFLVSIVTERELQPEDIAVALTGTGNAAANPQHGDRVSVMWAHPEDPPKVAPPLSRYVGYRCAACGQTHSFGESCRSGMSTREAVRLLAAEGLIQAEIARRLGVSREWVRRIGISAGIDFYRRPKKEPRIVPPPVCRVCGVEIGEFRYYDRRLCLEHGRAWNRARMKSVLDRYARLTNAATQRGGRGRAWTPEEDRLLLARPRGQTLAAWALEHGRSYSAASQRQADLRALTRSLKEAG